MVSSDRPNRFVSRTSEEEKRVTMDFGDKTPEQVITRVNNVLKGLDHLRHELEEAIRPSWKCCNQCCPDDYHPYAGMHKEPCPHSMSNNLQTANTQAFETEMYDPSLKISKE